MLASASEFFPLLFSFLPALLPRLAVAWIFTVLFLWWLFTSTKSRLRPRLLYLDDVLRAWAQGLRFRVTPDGRSERVLLTWFFRFWTNFASSPSLSFWSLVVPWWMHARAPQSTFAFASVRFWLLPGVGFLFAMSLSWLLKRAFKRVRPPRGPQDFGHRMKDHSFPSGHSLTAFCFWSLLTVSLAHAGAAPLAVVAFGLVAATIVALTGLSRVYLGVHFPSDVLGGFAIGALWSSVCYFALHSVLSQAT